MQNPTRLGGIFVCGGEEASMFELNSIDNCLVTCYNYNKF